MVAQLRLPGFNGRVLADAWLMTSRVIWTPAPGGGADPKGGLTMTEALLPLYMLVNERRRLVIQNVLALFSSYAFDDEPHKNSWGVWRLLKLNQS